MRLVEQARSSRSKFQTSYNNFFDLAAPWRPRVGEKATPSNPKAPSEQDNIFDTTLQDAADDWASDCSDEFTPSYKPWTTYVVVGGADRFSKAAQDKIKEFVKNRQTVIYDKIAASGFEEQSHGAYVDLAIAPTGMDIPFTPAGQGLTFEHVPISELLFLPGPFGGPGDRMREREIEIRHLDVIWPDANWEKCGRKDQRKKSTETVTVIQAYSRDWSNRSEEVWTEYLLCHGASVRAPVKRRGAGSCRLIVCRPRVSAPSAYGIGFGNKAVPPARVLDEMAYLQLKRQGKVVDAPYLYWDDGTLNLDGGIDAGEWLEAGENFNVEDLSPKNDGRESWFVQEDLRAQVRRALFQDKPYQRGDTPPTATQWMDEQSMNARRKSFPRAQITREFVLPILRRAEWILKERKEIEDITVENELVRLEPISPMSRASDLAEVQMADQHMSLFANRFGEAVKNEYNLPEMMRMAAEKLGSDVIVIATAEERRQKQSEDAQNAAIARGGGQPTEPTG